jgi:ABC-type multidrug transport system permease subunit
VWVLTRRTLLRVVRTPEQLLNVTLQPLVLVLLFSYVFDGAFAIPGLTDYRDYLIAGVFAVNMSGTAQGTAIGLAVDLDTGLVDRFRSLPMARSTVLVGRTLADLCLSAVAGAVTVSAGLAVGWRIQATPGGVVLALALALLFGYAASWAGVGIGLLARGPEAAQAVGMMVVLPLSLTSNAFISVDHMTPWLREVAVWNPISVLAAACRDLLGNPNPAASLPDWPMRHPVLASGVWSTVLLAVLVPAAAALYRRRAGR